MYSVIPSLEYYNSQLYWRDPGFFEGLEVRVIIISNLSSQWKSSQICKNSADMTERLRYVICGNDDDSYDRYYEARCDVNDDDQCDNDK